MLKVLVSAYACEPHKGSEPGVGWNWAKQIAKFAEVWVITRANNREVIEEELKKNPETNLHFVYVDLPRWMRFWKKGQRGVHLYYYLWQLALYFRAKKLAKKSKFDIAHHLTFGNFSFPSTLSLIGIPFILGPIGGVDRIPSCLKTAIGLRGYLFELFRDIMHKIYFILDPLMRITYKKAKFILCRTKATQRFVTQRIKGMNIVLFSETGLHFPIELNCFTNFKNETTELSVLFSGRLIPLKGLALALHSFKIFCEKYPNVIFHIIGDGCDKSRLLKLTKSLGILEKVVYWGFLPRSAVLSEVKKCDIFFFPSLREGGSWSLLEAMGLSKPIVCLNTAGPREVVTDECGIKVKPITFEQTVNDLADALLKLANDPELRRKMGEAGRRRVMEHYTWEKKGEFIKKVYEEVLGRQLSANC